MALHTHGNQPSRRRTLNTVDDVFNIPTTNQEVEVIGDSYIHNKHSTDIDIHDESFEPIVLLKEPFEIEVEAEPEGPSDIMFIVPGADTITIALAGSGTADIDWGDGDIQTVTLIAYDENFYDERHQVTHVFTGASTVRIINAVNIAAFASQNDSVTVIELSELMVNLAHIRIDEPITEFVTHAEWVDLDYLSLDGTLLSALEVHEEWVNLRIFYVQSPNITTIETFSSWTKLIYFALANCPLITSVTLHKEWVLLGYLGIYNTSIPSITTHKEWIKMTTINVRYSIMTTVEIHKEWTLFDTLLCENSQITSITLFPELINLRTLAFEYSQLTSLVLFNTMQNNKIYDVDLYDCKVTDATVINNLLIVLDSVITSNSSVKVIRLSGGTNAAPTGAGITAKNSIISKGCTVQTN